MTIGVDAGMLSSGDERLKVGVWRVAYNGLKELSKLDTVNRYRLYSFSPIPRETLKKFGPRMENRVLRPVKAWFTLRLPIELRVHPVDVFLGFAQALPPGPARKIGFIYDLGFIDEPSLYPASAKRLTRQTNELVTRAHQIITISETSKKHIVDHYHVPGATVAVTYPGIDNVFSPHGDAFGGDHPYFLFVGSLKRSKNLPFLLRSFALFLNRSKKVYDLFLVGSDYELDPEIPKTIESLNLSSRAKIHGFVPDRELATFYRGATAFVTPSLVEGFCLPAAEAMACGTPVIASTIPALKEIVGTGGLYGDPSDEESLARLLSTLVDNAPLKRALSKHALVQARKFRWGKFANSILQLLNA